MDQARHSLKVFVYYALADKSIVKALHERLELDGVDVILPDPVILKPEAGGSWVSPPDEILSYSRLGLDASSDLVYGNDLGFRCAWNANP